MHTTQRYLYQPGDLEGAARALDIYETPVDAYVRVIYTKQQGADWRYCIGQCVLGSNADGDGRQDYPAFVFVSKVFDKITLKQLLESLASVQGLQVHRIFRLSVCRQPRQSTGARKSSRAMRPTPPCQPGVFELALSPMLSFPKAS